MNFETFGTLDTSTHRKTTIFNTWSQNIETSFIHWWIYETNGSKFMNFENYNRLKMRCKYTRLFNSKIEFPVRPTFTLSGGGPEIVFVIMHVSDAWVFSIHLESIQLYVISFISLFFLDYQTMMQIFNTYDRDV